MYYAFFLTYYAVEQFSKFLLIMLKKLPIMLKKLRLRLLFYNFFFKKSTMLVQRPVHELPLFFVPFTFA